MLRRQSPRRPRTPLRLKDQTNNKQLGPYNTVELYYHDPNRIYEEEKTFKDPSIFQVQTGDLTPDHDALELQPGIPGLQGSATEA